MTFRRVLHIAPTPFFADRGCHIRIRGIVRALQDRGLSNMVCTYPIGRDVAGIKTARCARIPGYKKTEAGPSAFKYLADLLLIWTTARHIRSFRPDVLHCHLHEGVLVGWVARWLAMQRRLPVVFDMQGSLTGELGAHGYFGKNNFLMAIFRWLEAFIVRRADIYVASSEASVRLLTDEYDVARNKIAVVRDGADVEEIEARRNDAGNGPFAYGGVLTAIYTGGLSESKGLLTLQKLVAMAGDLDLQMRFIIVGYPTADLEAFLETHGLTKLVRLAGQVNFDDLAEYLGQADVAIEPKPAGAGEASGKVVNYMAAGLPVVCFDTPNNRDMLGDHGYFAPVGDAQGMMEQLLRVAGAPEAARQCARAGVERVRKRFSWSAAADTIIGVYACLDSRVNGNAADRENREAV